MQPARHLRVVEPVVEPATPPEFHERRYHTPMVPLMVACRVCFARTTLTADRLELSDGRVYHRCPECDGASLIRGDDVALLEASASVAAPEPWSQRFAARVGFTSVLMMVVTSVAAWLAVTVTAIAWVVNG